LELLGEHTANTIPFNVTGHPALSIPTGLSQGLPVGMMIVGRKYDESTIFRVAHAFEEVRIGSIEPRPINEVNG
jgi:amidase